ncbi:MAG: PEGA domain-containing protein [Vicinamibacterales bacterium]
MRILTAESDCVTFFRSRPGVPSLTRDDPSSFAPPPAFGPFRVLHQIGVGALGPVFRTYEPTRDRLVAVKVFRLDVTPEQAQALADELAHAAEAELMHPSIVEPIAAGMEGTVAYRAEEYVAAESLDAAMRHYAPAPFDTTLRIIGQLCEAVDSARAAGVGHGALHPRDIFITPDEARASGFGVVDALERVGLRAPVRRPYSAPERIAGRAWSTPADVFSLGAMAFELLTGRRPVGTGDDIGPLTGATGASAERVQLVLARAMAEDPQDRYPTGLALADALAEACAAVPAVPPPFADEEEPHEPALATPAATAAPGIRMIALPAEPPVFADEGVGHARELTTPSLFVDVPPHAADPIVETQEPALAARIEPDDIAAERDDDEAHWALTQDEDAVLAAAPIDARDLQAAEFAPADVAAAADALAFDAVDLTLREAPPAVDDFHRFTRAERETVVGPAPVDIAEPVGAEDAYDVAFEPPPFDPGERAPQQVIERQIPPLSTQDADERVPFEDHAATGERARPAVLPLALMLLIGLLIGYLVRGLQPAPPATTVAGATVPPATVSPTTEEPAGSPAGTGGAAAGRSGGGRAVMPPPAARAAAPPAARSGTLVVRSAPSGAGVTINGKWSGRTPLTRKALSFGDYTVRVILPGYQSKPEQVSLSADAASRTLSVQLQKEAPRATPPAAATRPTPAATAPAATRPAPETPGSPMGVLEIDSRPSGAQVFVDDRAVGTTPVRLPEFAPGSHVVRLELPEHRMWTETAQVTRGKTTRVAGSLEPIR